MNLKTDYKDFQPSTELRQFEMITNQNGTISLKDVTTYVEEGDTLVATDVNEITKAINSGANTWVVKTVETIDESNNQYNFVIDNFIYTPLNIIVFKAPKLADEKFLFTINSIHPNNESDKWYQIAFSDLSTKTTSAWEQNSVVVVSLSNTVSENGNTLVFVSAGGSGGGNTPSYTLSQWPTCDSNCQFFGTLDKGYAELYSSGTITFYDNVLIDIFMVGGGGAGSSAVYYSASRYYGGPGGGGGYTKTFRNISIYKNKEYIYTIGAGGNTASANGGNTIFEDYSVSGGNGGGTGSNKQDGGDGGSGGGAGGITTSGNSNCNGANGGSNGANGSNKNDNYLSSHGGNGQGVSTYEFLDSQLRLFAGGGGGAGGYYYPNDNLYYGSGGAGGAGGGGNGSSSRNGTIATSGAANTGGGGGGAGYGSGYTYAGGGGSGIIIIRWGNWNPSI